MNISKKASLIVLATTSLVCSRAMFAFIQDPEGPNLLIVTVLGAIVYALSAGAYVLVTKTTPTGLMKILFLISIQVLIVTGLYFCLN